MSRPTDTPTGQPRAAELERGCGPAAACARIAWLALCMLLLDAGAAAAAGVEDCERERLAQPTEYASYVCFVRVAREPAQASDAAARLARLAGDEPWARLALAHVHYLQQRWEPAAAQYEQAAHQLGAAGRPLGEVLARTNLWSLHFHRGELERAAAQVQAAGHVLRDEVLLEARVRVWLLQASHLIYVVGDLSLAHRALLRADRALERERDAIAARALPGLQAELFRTLGDLCMSLGRHREARRWLERVLELEHTPEREADIALRIAQAKLLEQELRPNEAGRAEAIALVDRAITLARRAAAPAVEAQAAVALGALVQAEQPARATELFEQCSQAARELGLLMIERECTLWIAEFDTARGTADTERLQQRALDLASESGDDTDRVRAWGAQLRALWRTRAYADAARETRHALDAIDTLRAGQGDALRGAQLVERMAQRHYGWLAGRILEAASPDLELALDVLERARARALHEALEAEAEPQATAPVGAGALARGIAGVQRALADPALAEVARRRALDDLEELEIEEEVQRALAGSTRSRAEPQAAVATLAELQAALEPDRALLVFHAGLERDVYGRPSGGAWLIVISASETFRVPIPDRRALASAVPLFVGLLEQRDGSEQRPAESLGEALLGGALARLPREVRRLVIVPDGALHALPFAALHWSGAPVGVQFELVTAASASLWQRGHRLRAEALPARALVLADPDPDTQHAARAPVFRGLSLQRGIAAPRLPGARAEGHEVLDALGGSGWLWIGAEASERVLKRAELRQFGLLHVAAHAVADEGRPGRSFVLLAPGAEDEDGLLQPREIRELDLEQTGVVLSACQGVAGQAIGGEGVFSLARAFLEAGAPAVIGSLWPLRDDDARWLIRAFYRHARGGASFASALQSMRRDALAAGLPAHAWSALVVLGNGDLRLQAPPQRADRSSLWLAAGLVIAAGLIAARGRVQRPPRRR